MPECGPDEPSQREDDGHADQPHQERTWHPRLGIAAAQPLGDIGHAPILALLLAHRARWTAYFVVTRRGKAPLLASPQHGGRDFRRSQHLEQICNRLGKREESTGNERGGSMTAMS